MLELVGKLHIDQVPTIYGSGFAIDRMRADFTRIRDQAQTDQSPTDAKSPGL